MESCISDSPEGFERISLWSNITALKILNNFLFVAESNEIIIYDWKLKESLLRKSIFDSCTIHGIRINNDNKFLVFGSKQIKILTLIIDNEISVTNSDAINLSDWILDVQWISGRDKKEYIIAALTAHNSLILLKETGVISQTFHCSENCILYSASIISSAYHSLVLAVGTVFQKVLLWSPFSDQNEVGRNVPFQQLSGHQGVIFSVTYNDCLKILCSTSDDRSLRVWKVHSKDQNASSSLEFWKNSTIECIHVLYAHESRVWRSVILDSCILSIGEDSLICVWNLEGTLLKKFKGHKNGSIWCIETTPQDDNQNNGDIFAFTGGSDGGVYSWNITEALQPNLISQLSKESNIEYYCRNQSASIEINAEHLATGKNRKEKERNFPRVCLLYTIENSENLLVYMGTGELYAYNLQLKSWENVFFDNSISNYCIVSISSHGSYIALGTFSGVLILMHEESSSDRMLISKFQVCDSIICSLHWCNDTEDAILVCGTEGKLSLWKVLLEKKFELRRINDFFLPKCKIHWWSTAALFLSSDNILVVGDRGGNVSTYSTIYDSNIERAEPLSRLQNIHGDNGVTDIKKNDLFIYISGRDGKVNQYYIEKGKINFFYALKVCPDMEWIGKIIFYESDVLFAGFHTKNFVVWSSHLESAVMNVECGGGHRSWDFSLTKEGVASFVAIQKKDVIYKQQNLHHMLKESVLKNGISGQKLCCVSHLYSESFPNGEGSQTLLLCGGEDNTLRLVGINFKREKYSKAVLLKNISGHLSSIRAIYSKRMNRSEFLVASVGGRSQIILWNFVLYHIPVSVQLLSTMLLGSNEKSKSKSKENIQSESQTRLMDVSISYSYRDSDLTTIFDIGVACSDGYFRLYKFDVPNKELTLKHIVKHDENCILKLATLNYGESAFQQKISYIIGATNGSLKILRHDNYLGDYKALNEVVQVKNCHQSGINAIDFAFIVEPIWMVCTGGDDNSLMISFINLDTWPSVKEDIKVVSRYQHLNAHASQIIGVRIIDPFTILTASIDQRINVWKLKYHYSPEVKVTMSLHRSIISLIPDISNLRSWKYSETEWKFLVCGQGFEVFTYTHELNLDFKDLMLHFQQDHINLSKAYEKIQ